MKKFFSSYIQLGFLSSIFLPIAIFSKTFDNWIGLTPYEIIPSVKPLGSLAERYLSNERNESLSRSPEPFISADKDKNESLNSAFIMSVKDTPKQKLSNDSWIGLNPVQIIPNAIPLGSMKDRNFNKAFSNPVVLEETETDVYKPDSLPFNLSLFASSRAYETNNVLRTKENEMDSGVWENTGGFSFGIKPVELGKYVTLVPHLDFIMQWANYGEETVKDLLDYRFGMVLGKLDFYLPKIFLSSLVLNTIFYTASLQEVDYLMLMPLPFP